MPLAPAPLGPIKAVPALVETDAWLLDLLDGLSADDWDRETIVRGWRVRHVAGHLLDTALRRLSVVRDGVAVERPASGSPEDVRAFVDRINAEGVAVYGRLSPRVLRAQMAEAATALHEHLRQLDPMAPAVFAVSWAGETTSPNWFDTARELTERWHHQQQIRLALDRPGILTRAMYHPVLDCFVRVLPHAYRAVDASPGTDVEFHVSGDAGGTWHLMRTGEGWGLFAIDDDPSEEEPQPRAAPAARITVPEDAAWRLFTKALPAEEAERVIVIEGDRTLAAAALGATAIVG
jgi:uncharacterized protein (TIGR03083 family)